MELGAPREPQSGPAGAWRENRGPAVLRGRTPGRAEGSASGPKPRQGCWVERRRDCLHLQPGSVVWRLWPPSSGFSATAALRCPPSRWRDLSWPCGAAETGCPCVHGTGGRGNGVSSVLQLCQSKKEINSESRSLITVCERIRYSAD